MIFLIHQIEKKAITLTLSLSRLLATVQVTILDFGVGVDFGAGFHKLIC